VGGCLSRASGRPLNFTVKRTLTRMRTLLRLLAAFVATVATYYLVFWLGGALIFSLLPRQLSYWITLATSMLVAILVGRYVWMQTGSLRTGFFRFVALGSLLTGAITFSAGFFGPILFTPHANQGPLLGIFITGPLGFILGGVGGAVHWLIRRDHKVAQTDGPPNNRRGP
jgi:hypothetical protein